MIGLVNLKPDESAVVKLDLELTSFASVDPNKMATIFEVYWGTSSGKVYGNTITLRLGPDSGKARAIYQIIIKFTKVDDKSQLVYSGGGATLAYLVVKR